MKDLTLQPDCGARRLIQQELESAKMGVRFMLIQISEIKVNPGRREADPEGVQDLVDSISKVGLINPITVDREHTLIAGLHRLEAVKLLGWTEI